MLRPLTLLQPSCGPRLEKALLGCLNRGRVFLAKRVTVLVSSCTFHIRFSFCVGSSWAAAAGMAGLAPSPGWFQAVEFFLWESCLWGSASGEGRLYGAAGQKPHVSSNFGGGFLAVLLHQPVLCLGQLHLGAVVTDVQRLGLPFCHSLWSSGRLVC